MNLIINLPKKEIKTKVKSVFEKTYAYISTVTKILLTCVKNDHFFFRKNKIRLDVYNKTFSVNV